MDPHITRGEVLWMVRRRGRCRNPIGVAVLPTSDPLSERLRKSV
jgi:hypothetical protein